MLKKLLLLLMLFFFILSWLPAENWVLISHLDTSETAEPYEEDEFPQWMWYLRRFEVMLFGSFPLVYILTSFSYDLFYMAYSGGEATFGSKRDQEDLYTMVAISASISGVIAIADLIISLIKEGRSRRAQVQPQSFTVSW